jgi:streptogramin lyase
MATVHATDSVSFPMTMPNGITRAPGGDSWFSDTGTPSGIGRTTSSGVTSEFGVPAGLHSGAEPDALTAGPDGNVWLDD